MYLCVCGREKEKPHKNKNRNKIEPEQNMKTGTIRKHWKESLRVEYLNLPVLRETGLHKIFVIKNVLSGRSDSI